MNHKLGLKRSLNFKLHFGDYADLGTLLVPDQIDWSPAVSMTKPYDKTMFGNDRYGDCFWAAAAKYLMTQSANAGDMFVFTTEDVLGAYAKATGFNPDIPSTDQGTEPAEGFKYLQNVGIKGQRFGAPLSVSPTRIDMVMAALHLCGGLMVGLDFFQEWENDQTWGVVGSDPIGGHEVPCFKADRSEGLYIETWGETTFRFVPWDSLARNCTQLTVSLTPAFLANGQAPNGFEANELLADLAKIS